VLEQIDTGRVSRAGKLLVRNVELLVQVQIAKVVEEGFVNMDLVGDCELDFLVASSDLCQEQLFP
jgi:hypothetical protein